MSHIARVSTGKGFTEPIRYDKQKCEKIANKTMVNLMSNGVPYHKKIRMLIEECEFHYQLSKGECLSSPKEAISFLRFDTKTHSEMWGLGYEIGKRIFHFWAGTCHQKKYLKLMDNADEIEGIEWKPEKIVLELKALVENCDFKPRTVYVNEF